jgi:uncharacterized glyoxalase superfamily protein PhnB
MKTKKTEAVRSAIMRSVKSTNTKPEMVVRRLAHRLGFRFRLPQGMTADMILHARFMVGDTVVMASDGPHVEPMRSAYLALSVDNNEEAERIYKALTEGGQVFMAMTETFFAHRFGQFRDKFGVNWMVIHERPMPRG